MPSVRLSLVAQQTLREWQRDRLLQIHAELEALRMDRARLVRAATKVMRCDRCRRPSPVTAQEDDWWYCDACAFYTKEVRA